MKENRGLIFKLFFLGGLLMMFAYAFLPLISFTFEEGKTISISMWLLTWVTTLISQVGDVFSGFIDLEEATGALKFLILIPALFIWIPLIIQIVSGVMLFVKKDTKIVTGMVIVNTVYTFIMNLGLFIGIRALAKALQIDAGMEAIIKSGVIGPVLFIAGGILCLVMAIIVHLINRPSDEGGKVVPGESGVSLMCVSGEMAGAKVPLYDGQSVTIGRSGKMASFVVKDDPKVSRRHCKIEYMEDEDRVYVTDYSTNGTMLGDGTHLIKDIKTPVARGTLIILSPTTKFTVGD